MKKLFTLLAFLTCFLGANAVEIVDAYVDFSQYTDISEVKWYGWGASDQAKERLSIVDGCLHYESSEVPLNDQGEPTGWLCQFHPIGGVKAEVDVTYTLHFKIKGDHDENVSMLGFGTTPYGQFPITSEWVEGTVDYVCTSASGDMLMQCGSYIGTWDLAYLKITHEGKEEAPVKWVEILENGDAETPWADPDTRWNDEENNFKICAWSKEREVNMNDDGGWDPFPAGIEEDPADPSNHVFVCHGNEATTEGDAAAWDNQFWIESPKAWNAGEEFQLSFRYKANKSVTAQTQFHLQNPSNYKHYAAIGDIAFTEEWQTYEGTVTVPDAAAGSWSIAFNLNANDHDAIDFYFDDLSWKKMDLEEGLFIVGANKETGIEYEYDQAIAFEYDEAEAAYFVTIGTEGKQDSWVKEVQISTVKGNSRAFKANTLKPTGNINDPEEWGPYTTASNYKIDLPAAGVWTIGIDTNEGSINFQQVEGDAPWEPIEFVENPTEIVLNAQPRTSQDWDSQFWIVSNTPLKAGTKTYLKFDYSIEPNDYIEEALVGTQTHAAPGDYIDWHAIGDLTFTTDVQTFEGEFEIPSEVKDDKPMQSLAFNMARVKDVQVGEETLAGIPVTYKITNVIWGLANHKESLIDMENTDDDNPNFVLKEGDGWGLHNYGTAPIPPSQGVEGDINGDGEPGIGDLICITNYMTDGDASGYTLEQCDLNKDNEVGIGDVITLTNIMAGSAE